jgi:hypothetical protein
VGHLHEPWNVSAGRELKDHLGHPFPLSLLFRGTKKETEA